jgi:type IV pilus assembly protein PilW
VHLTRTPGVPASGPARSRGFTLIELMIAVTIGLLILATLTTIFVKNNQARLETERTSQQIENGRYAIQLLSEELRHAGYYAEYIPPLSLPATFTAKPDACLTNTATIASAAAPAFLLHVQGYDDGASAPSCVSGADLKAGTDILVVRRVSTCPAGTAGCDAVASDGTPYFQASLCTPPVVGGTAAAGTQLSSTNTQCPLCSDYFGLGLPASLGLHKRDCKTVANLRAYVTRIYFIANNDSAGDGIPTLKRAELGPNGFSIVPMVQGIENMQFEYGIDSNGDGIPDLYTANPDGIAATACGSPTASVCNWWNAMTVNIHLLARNTQRSPNDYVDNKTYNLGLTAAGAENNVGPFGDNYRRHAYEATVRFANPAGRRQ